MAEAGGLWVVRERRLEEMKWKSKRRLGRVSSVSLKSQASGWQAVGSRGMFSSRREAGPSGGWLLGTGQTMEEKSVSRGAYARDCFRLRQEARRGSQVPP